MIAFDTNILFAALSASSAEHAPARAWLETLRDRQDVVLCELVLLEVYTLLRNPTVCRNPLSGAQATQTIQHLRQHPAWRMVDYDPAVADALWAVSARDTFAYRRIYDARLALTLRHHGVREFATRNEKDFQGFGFAKVWNPLLS